MSKKEEARFCKRGNTKLGESIWTFNKLAGAGVLNGIKGTCNTHCKGCYNHENPMKSECYVFKAYRLYKSVIESHSRNTVAMRRDLFGAFWDLRGQISRCIKEPAAVRIHSSGELESVEELRQWIITAAMFPDIPIYIYTKAFRIVDLCLKEMVPESFPKNFYLNVSIWHQFGISCFERWKHFPNVRAFVYDDGSFKYPFDVSFYCPAYDKNGKMNHDITCDKCRVCYSYNHKICGCRAH